MSDEEYVRSKWEPLYGPSCSYGGELRVLDGSRPDHTMRIGWANNFEELWSAAAAFTREREEQIREIEEEISAILPERVHFADNAITHMKAGRAYEVAISVKWEARFARILSRLQAQLTELKKGMKEQSNGK